MPRPTPAHRPPGSPLPPGADLAALLHRAAAARPVVLPPATTIHRLVNAEGDGLPGLVVDVYGPVAVVQAYEEAWRGRLAEVCTVLQSVGWPSVRAVVRGTSGASVGEELRRGAPLPDEFTAHEAGLAFRIRPADTSLSVGLFTQARGARARVRLMSRDRNVLNLFAYAGGFTVAALAGGARTVDQVDAAARTAPWSARNVTLNGHSTRCCRFVVDDALAFTARAVRQGRRYGLCIVDIPTFGHSDKGRHSVAGSAGGATRGLLEAITAGLEATESGGRLLLGTNARTVTVPGLWSAVQQAATEANVQPVLEEMFGPGPDFPGQASAMEWRELKSMVVRVER